MPTKFKNHVTHLSPPYVDMDIDMDMDTYPDMLVAVQYIYTGLRPHTGNKVLFSAKPFQL